MADPEDEPIDEPSGEPQPDQAALAVVARHALHDEELIAAFAGGDLEAGEEADRARSLTERCAACRDLHRDIQLIDGFIRAAETASDFGARVSAPRDFRLTVDDARRLGGPVPVAGVQDGGVPVGGTLERGFLGRFGTVLTGFARPLGASMATLGAVGLLVGSMTVGSGAMPSAVDNGAPTSGPAAGEVNSGGAPSATGSISLSSGSTDNPEPSRAVNRDAYFGSAASSASVLQVGSFALLLGGLALLVIGLRGRGRRRE